MQKTIKAKLNKTMALGLAFLVLCMSFAVCFPAMGARAATSRDFINPMTENQLREFAQTVLRNKESLKSENILSSSAVEELQAYLSDAAEFSEERLSALKSSLNDSLNSAFDKLSASSGVVSTLLKKVGLYTGDLNTFLNYLGNHPAAVAEFLVSVASDGLLGSLSRNGNYYVSSDTVEKFRDIAADYIDFIESEYFISVSSIAEGDLNAFLLDAFSYDTVVQSQIYEKYDIILSKINYDPSRVYYFMGEKKYYRGSYDYSSFVVYSLPADLALTNNDIDYITSLDNFGVSQPVNDIDFYNVQLGNGHENVDVTSALSNYYYVQTFFSKNLPWKSSNTTYYGFFTNDGRYVKLWKSKYLHDKYYGWGGGVPSTGILYNPSIRNSTTNNDNSFSVTGDYISKQDISNDYSQLTENVVTNNDYSDSSVTTIINNYYGSDTGGGTSDSPTHGLVDIIGNTLYELIKDFLPIIIRAILEFVTDGGTDILDLVNTILQLLPDDIGDQISPYLPDIIDYVLKFYSVELPSPNNGGSTEVVQYSANTFLQELDTVGQIVPTFTQKLSNFTSFPAQFGTIVASSLAWIPQDYIDLLVLGLSGTLVIALIKFLRG